MDGWEYRSATWSDVRIDTSLAEVLGGRGRQGIFCVQRDLLHDPQCFREMQNGAGGAFVGQGVEKAIEVRSAGCECRLQALPPHRKQIRSVTLFEHTFVIEGRQKNRPGP